MQIEHVAIWCGDIDRLKGFYETWFGAIAGERYVNAKTGLESYFLSFTGGARLELMQRPDVTDRASPAVPRGLAHLALVVGIEGAVDALTVELAQHGHRVAGQPRRTGDGYYESVVLDPEGNRVELVAERGGT
ncbi:MAG: VOC family protein [Pseudomonadota bacterium]